jgi:enoyl-[acyl-carrier protein] reductase III
LVTGSARGIGKAVVVRLSHSHDCIVHYRNSEEEAEGVAQIARSNGARVSVARADLRDETAVDQLFDQIRDEFGNLDVLVASAAATRFGTLQSTQRRHLERTLATVVLSYHQMVGRMSTMLGDNARVIAVSGLDARFAQAGHGALGAAKAALESLTRSWAVELAPKGCTVNAVLPGAIATDSLDAYFRGNDPARSAMVRGTPAGRLGTVDEIAELIEFLASSRASFITGQVLVIDGGVSAEGGGWSHFRDLWNE